MEKPIRSLTVNDARQISQLIDINLEMFEGFIPKMVKQGVYVILDRNGKRMPTEQALMEITS